MVLRLSICQCARSCGGAMSPPGRMMNDKSHGSTSVLTQLILHMGKCNNNKKHWLSFSQLISTEIKFLTTTYNHYLGSMVISGKTGRM